MNIRSRRLPAEAEYCYKATGTLVPYIRADWFVFKASVPPLYHDILEMPTTDRELEERLRVDVHRNLRTGRAARAGFNRSGVSQNNRLIERHAVALTRGAYWKSYDFSANTGPQNLFARPLGPTGPNAFQHAGGEIIFNLPNGLQAYLLIDAKGNRIDKGPTEIVRDTKRPDGAVVNGLSCMSCHTKGMIFKDDQVRLVVLGNEAFPAEVRNKVQRLYPPKKKFHRLQEEDAKRFAGAVTETGGTVGTTEPIMTLALRFEEELDLPLAAAEAGLTADDFRAGLAKSPQLAQTLAPLLIVGGTVKRDVYIANFATVIRELGIGRQTPVPTMPKTPPGIPPQAVVPLDSDQAKAKQKGWAHHLGPPVQITNSLGMKFNLIPPGDFTMGSPKSEPERLDDETQHLVKITKPFYLSAHEVTQAQYQRVMGKSPSYFSALGKGKDRVSGDTSQLPVEQVSWSDAVAFCGKLSEREGVEYRLPTEAEWEYACRAGTTTTYSFGNNVSQLGEYAWYDANSRETTHPVGEKLPNAWGLFDMHGNVYEWCQDLYGPYESLQVVSDPTGPASSGARVLRGGAFVIRPKSSVRAAYRTYYRPGDRNHNIGFRLARTYPLSP